jgi:hypothetical protein
MPDPRNDSKRRPLLRTVILAGALLLTPPVLARFGPTSVRQLLHTLQMGALADFSAGDEGALRFTATHRHQRDLLPDRRYGIGFPFVNRSDRPIALTRTWASCGCVRVKVPPAPVPPGGAGEVVVELDTKGMLHGATWQLAKVYTDAAPRVPYLLMIEAEIR